VKVDRADNFFAEPELRLIGGGLTLTLELPNAGVDWMEYGVVLDEMGGWRVSGRAPTRDEMFQVLESLDSLRIRGEFRAGADAVVSVVSAVGTVSGFSGGCAFRSADGSDACGSTTHVLSVGGISGLRHDAKVMFLTGVFLDDGAAVTPAPPLLDETGADAREEFEPLLGQSFHIGDGRTQSGELQRFHAPAGATRLFLGFVEAFQFGEPDAPAVAGFYGDNGGSLNVVLDVE
jgi:hypothetical protein